MYKRGMLALGQRQVELIHNTLVADGGEQAQADIADAVFAVETVMLVSMPERMHFTI